MKKIFFLFIFLILTLSISQPFNEDENEDIVQLGAGDSFEEDIQKEENPINYFKWTTPPKVQYKKRVIIAKVRHIKDLSSCVSKLIIQKKFKWFMSYGLKTPSSYFKISLFCSGKRCFNCLLNNVEKDIPKIVSKEVIGKTLGPLSYTSGYKSYHTKIKDSLKKLTEKLKSVNKLVRGKKDSVKIEVDSEGTYRIWLNDINPDMLIRLKDKVKLRKSMVYYGDEVEKMGKNLRRVTSQMLKDKKVELKIDVGGSKKYVESTKFSLSSWCKKCRMGFLIDEKTMSPYFEHERRSFKVRNHWLKPYPLLQNAIGGTIKIGKSVKYVLKHSKVSFIVGEKIGFTYEQLNSKLFVRPKPLVNFLFGSLNTNVKDLPSFMKTIKYLLSKKLNKAIKKGRTKCRQSTLSFSVLFNLSDLMKSQINIQVRCKHPRVSLSKVSVAFNNFISKKCTHYPSFTGGFEYSTTVLKLVGKINTHLSLIGCSGRKCMEDCFPLKRRKKLTMNLPKLNIGQIEERLKNYKQTVPQAVKDLKTTIKAFHLFQKLNE